MRDLRRTLEAVQRIAEASQGDTSLSDLFARVCAVVAEAFDFDRVSLARYHPATAEVSPVALHGDSPEQLPDRLRLADLPLLTRAHASRDAVFVDDVRQSGALPAELTEAYGVTSVFALPLFSAGHCLGFLSGDRRGEPFQLDESELATLQTIGVIVATLLEKLLLREEMQRLDSLKSEFIALASHELRNPLATIYGISVTLDERGDHIDDEERAALHRTLRDQTARMRTLGDQLLDLSRLDVAAIQLTPEPVRLRATVCELLELLASPPETVSVAIPAELEALVDPVALDRILSNLVSNALRYGAPPVTVSAEQTDNHLRISVEDRGPGVAAEFVPRLFERFTRSTHSAEHGDGSGLGLSIARAYARAHGGEILYEPASPHGARFQLVLPHR